MKTPADLTCEILDALGIDRKDVTEVTVTFKAGEWPKVEIHRLLRPIQVDREKMQALSKVELFEIRSSK